MSLTIPDHRSTSSPSGPLPPPCFQTSRICSLEYRNGLFAFNPALFTVVAMEESPLLMWLFVVVLEMGRVNGRAPPPATPLPFHAPLPIPAPAALRSFVAPPRREEYVGPVDSPLFSPGLSSFVPNGVESQAHDWLSAYTRQSIASHLHIVYGTYQAMNTKVVYEAVVAIRG